MAHVLVIIYPLVFVSLTTLEALVACVKKATNLWIINAKLLSVFMECLITLDVIAITTGRDRSARFAVIRWYQNLVLIAP